MADMGTDFNGLPSAGTLEGTDVVPLQRGTGGDSTLRTTIAQILSMAGSGAQTGDFLLTARMPGGDWLKQDTVYSQSAYPDLFGLVGLIGDAPPGQNWATQTPTTGITTAVADACWITNRTAVAVGNNVIWRTTDAGNSWSSITVAGNLLAVCRVSDSAVIAVGQSGVILRSVDAGTTWTAITSSTTNNLRIIIVFTAARIYVGGDVSTARISTNGGASFVAGAAATAAPTRSVRFSPSVAVVFSASGTSAFRTTDGGGTWATVAIPTFANARHGVAFSSTTAIMGSLAGAVLRTVDAGATWTSTALTGVTSGTGFVSTGEGSAVFITTGTSYFTFDSGLNYSAVGTALTGATAAFSIADTVAVAVGNAVQYRSMAEYGYDPATQFKTPTMSGIGPSLAGYIKS